MDEEKVFSVQEDPNFHLNIIPFCHRRNAVSLSISSWRRLEFYSGTDQCPENRKNSKSVLILGLQSARIDVVFHNALWVSKLDQVHNPGTPAPNCSVTDCDIFLTYVS